MNTPRLLLLALLLLLAGPPSVLADTREGSSTRCALELTPADLAAYQANLAAGVYESDAAREQASYLVYLAFHVVRTSSGTGGIPQSQLDQALLDLAAEYDEINICFFVAYQDTINNSTYYNLDNGTERSALKAINNQPNALDCYFVNYDEGYCGVSAFSWSADQAVSFANDCVGVASNPSTFPHEIGHYFDLLHTHETAAGTECPDGSNCGAAGDLLCDTPADPGLGTDNVNTSCVYTGSATIYCNSAWRAYDPDPTNIMSYSRKTCRTYFSPNQRSRIVATLTGPRWAEVGFNAPDFDAPTPAGWTNALVPRSTTGGTAGSTPVTATLPGGGNTYLNMATHQSNSNAHFPFIHSRIYRDNVYIWWYSYGGSAWSGTAYYNDFGPQTVGGGRHSLHVALDWNDEVCETSETDNTDYSQWNWSPSELAADASLAHGAPPEKMTTTYAYPNCDGYQFNGVSWWSAVAIQPLGTTADYDVRLHDDYTGSTTGFTTYLANSGAGSGSPDWTLINHNQVGYGGTFQAGIWNYDGESADYRLNLRGSHVVSKFDGARAGGSLAANQILDILEFYVSADDQLHPWLLTLSSEQAADLDLFLYNSTTEYGTRTSYLSASTNVGPTESIAVTFGQAGWYALLVAKKGSADLGLACAYDVKFRVNEPRFTIYPNSGPGVAVYQDNAPWSGTEWTDQLSAQGITPVIRSTANLLTDDLSAYGLVIVPSPVYDASYSNVVAALPRLEACNNAGSVLILSTCTSSSLGDGDAWLEGITQTWQTCALAHPTGHVLMTGVAAEALGNSAVHYVFDSIPAGWSTLATTDCGTGQPCLLVNDTRGIVLCGAPLEHSVQYYNGSLGESIENLVAWGWKRARQTVRFSGTPISPSTNRSLYYRNPGMAGSVTWANTEGLGWLGSAPTSGTIPIVTSVPVSFSFLPAGQPVGTQRGTVSVTNSMYNSPETVYAVLTLATRQPLIPLIAEFYPVDFSLGPPRNATVHLTITPVTTGTDGQPITVEAYNIYYDEDPWLGSPLVFSTTLTSMNLYFGNVGMYERAFLRVTATDSNGLLLGDSRPDLPPPDPARVGQAPAALLQPR
ncbi:MAG: reprolysin-like metallopeptidase [Candidatus Delongbacteria bacterium]